MTSGCGPVPLVEVTRRDVLSGREIVESVHLGHLVAVDGEGGITHEDGDAQLVVFPRSALKPLQATLCLELLDGAGIDLTDEEIAVGWASHRAEPDQLAAVQALLARAGVEGDAVEDFLTCPRAPVPDDPLAPRSHLAHNCSGKHALFVLTAHALGLPTEREALLAHDGPLQTRLIEGLEEMLGRVDAVGVDGCGAPALALPLIAIARVFSRIAAEDRYSRVRRAGLAHPALVAGHERGSGGTRRPVVDTALLSAGVVAKRGAEGVLAAGWSSGTGPAGGIAVKASDGSMRGAATAVVAHLEALGVVPAGTWREAPPLGGGVAAGSITSAMDA
jgi:L-asparaginase II